MNVVSSLWTSTLTRGCPPLLTTLKGKCLMSFWTDLSLNFWPMRRFCGVVSIATAAARRSTYDIENGAVGVAGELVLGGVTNETLIVGESDPGRCDTVTWRGQLSVVLEQISMVDSPWSLTMISTFPFFMIPTQE